MSETRIAELDEVIAETIAIYTELADLPADYVAGDDDHWSVRMLCEMRTELAQLLGEIETCALCPTMTDDLYTRTDNRDDSEIRVCARCANTADVSCSDPIDA